MILEDDLQAIIEDDPHDLLSDPWEDTYDDPADMYVWDSDLHNNLSTRTNRNNRLKQSHRIPNTTPFGGKAKKGRGVFSLTPQPAGFLKIIVFFLGLCKGLGLCLPIIYNRIQEIDMTFFLLLIGACLVGFVGAEVMNAQ